MGSEIRRRWGPRKLWVNTGTKKAGEEGIPWTVHCDGPNGPLSCHVVWGTGPNREERGGPNGTIFAFFPRWWSLWLVRWSDPACGLNLTHSLVLTRVRNLAVDGRSSFFF